MRLPSLSRRLRRSFVVLSLTGFCFTSLSSAPAQDKPKPTGFAAIPTEPTLGDDLLNAYFETETRRITARSLANIDSAEDWDRQKDVLRRQLYESLGLQPLPARSPLEAKVTGRTERTDFVVENIVFESRPGLYVTANFYYPKNITEPLPTVLYVCGHGKVEIDGVSYGNKTYYQHHGAWFARNGYTCLTIDTLGLGEIIGEHHGTHHEGRWWWNSRGYTPAGVEAWNCIRALDYLETRPEVDKKRFGVTGRSGGGAYSWWIAALDQRIQCAVPVAGITSMHNHVVDGCVEGHCDCMYHINGYQWDFPTVAALVAPRPLLIANTDKDRIFPLDGVVDVYNKTRRIYELLDATDNIGLSIVEGPHADTQPLRVPAFQWFNRHLKGEQASEVFESAAVKYLEPQELKVLDEIPADERNTSIDEYFTREPNVGRGPQSASDWRADRDLWMSRLKSRSFRNWPGRPDELGLTEISSVDAHDLRFSRFRFQSQEPFDLDLFLVRSDKLERKDLDLVVLNVLDENGWQEFLSSVGAAFPSQFPQGEGELPELNAERFNQEVKMHRAQPWAMAYVCPRGVGPTAWTTNEKERTHIRRRFMLLGQTLATMQTWDARRAMQALRKVEDMEKVPLWLQSEGDMAVNTLYASLFEPDVARLDLHDLPASHRNGPDYLHVMRFLDIPQAVSMAADRFKVRLYAEESKEKAKRTWRYLDAVGKVAMWEDGRFQVRSMATPKAEKKN